MLSNKYLLIALIPIFFIMHGESAAGETRISGDAYRYSLQNGLNVILKEDHSTPVVAVQIWVKTGSANEPEDKAGITHVIEHMIFKGTPTRKTGEIARMIESSGGHINAYTTFDRTVYFIEIASDNFGTALDVLLDALQHSVFDATELEREKEVILEEYRRSLDQPEKQLRRAMLDLSYIKHPYRRPIIGYESTIRSINREDIMEYMDKWYTPKNMVLVAVGDFNAEEALTHIFSLTKDFPNRSGEVSSRPQEPRQISPRSVVLRSDVEQIYLGLSWHIPSVTHPHIPPLDIIEVLLGHGRSSRLFNRLKMEKNLVRSIEASSFALVNPGLFLIECTLSPPNTITVLKSIVDEIERICQEPIMESDLAKAKRMVEADYLSVMEKMEGQAEALAFFETMIGDMHKADEYLSRLTSVSADEIRNVANLYLKPTNLSVGVIVPEASGIALPEEKLTEILFHKSRKGPAIDETVAQEGSRGISKFSLPNGLRVIIRENPRLPLVSVRAAFLGGTRYEDPVLSGISGFTARMLTRGTQKMDASGIASTIESWGGSLEGFSGRNSFGISAKFLSRDLYPGMELLGDIIRNPLFHETEIEKVRRDILMEISGKKDDPVRLLSDLFNRTLYRRHPYGHSTTGTAESIGSITKSDIIGWHKSFMVPSNLVLAFVGDVKGRELIEKIDSVFKGFGPHDFVPPEILPEPPVQAERVVHLERPGNQVHIMMGYLGTSLKSPENAVMTLIDAALSGQGGRLFHELRDRQSLAYSVSAFRRPGLETGMFGVYLACDPKKLQIARDALFRELERIKDDGLSRKELEDAKKYVLGGMAIENQTDGSQAMRMALDELYGLGYDHLSRFKGEIESVTLEDVRNALERIFVKHGYVIATVGPLYL